MRRAGASSVTGTFAAQAATRGAESVDYRPVRVRLVVGHDIGDTRSDQDRTTNQTTASRRGTAPTGCPGPRRRRRKGRRAVPRRRLPVGRPAPERRPRASDRRRGTRRDDESARPSRFRGDIGSRAAARMPTNGLRLAECIQWQPRSKGCPGPKSRVKARPPMRLDASRSTNERPRDRADFAAERPAAPAPTMTTSTREDIGMRISGEMRPRTESISPGGQGIVLSRPLTIRFSGSTNGRSTMSHGWTSPFGSLMRRERPVQSPGSLNLT